jgi:zinc-binding alcohol dehydrogenase family protein
MKAVGIREYLPISDEASLLDLEVPKPSARGRDLLVAVEAIAVNPVDTKVRAPKDKVEDPPRILGWDAAGVVEAVGPDVTLFSPGDEVFYAGSITRPGSNSEFQIVDERIVGLKPRTKTFAEAAALPLTSITAWEALFDRFEVSADGEDAGKKLLIIGGAGGVGSIAIQLAKQVAGLEVIATASRAESTKWCLELGAHQVVNHRENIPGQLRALGIDAVEYVLCLNSTDQHWAAMAECVAPQGHICSIVETAAPVDLGILMRKSASFSWELMFTRPMFGTPDMIEQHRLLNEISTLVDSGRIRTTVTDVLRPISAANLRTAHARIEGGRTVGKIVLEGWAG